MPILKRNSRVLARAEQRLLGLRAISDTLERDGGVGVAVLAAAIRDCRAALEAYARVHLEAAALLRRITADERAVRDLCERTLAAVVARYGSDSNEYEKAGGVRKSARRRRAKVPPAA